MKRLLCLLLTIAASVFAGYHVICMWRGIVLSQKSYTRGSLLHAAKLDPSNPDPLHKNWRFSISGTSSMLT
jgi:hypothetical protein